jgi:hypothetical protein
MSFLWCRIANESSENDYTDDKINPAMVIQI